MRRRRKKRSQLSVSLFPFLAVLICTLGVLIVMLVMAVKSADMQADETQAEDDQEKQAMIDDLQNGIDIRSLQIEGLEISRPEVVLRLSDSRSNRSYLEDEIRKLKQEFRRMGEELVELTQAPDIALAAVNEFSQTDADAAIEELKRKVVLAESELKSKRAEADQAGESKYVIVPHKGGGGTFRRPIYLECTRDGITLRPSGIRLETREFAPPLEAGNMLDSALLAIREYWQRYDLAGEHGSPYPLIVVRPGGSETFMLARRAMKSWDDEFGYELVESDKPLDFGAKDPQLETEIRDAISEARRRQRSRQARFAATENQASRYSASAGRPGLVASNVHGGFVESPMDSMHNESGSDNPGGRDDLFSGSRDFVEFSDSNDAFISGETSLDHFRDRRDRMVRSRNSQGQGEDRDNSTLSGQPSRSSNSSAASNQFRQPSSNASAQSSVAANNPAGQAGNVKQGKPMGEQSLAKNRGKNWALPTQTPGATGYLRPIRVLCGSNYLDVVESAGSTKRIPMTRETLESIDPLIEEIWKQIESWGISGANSFWKPQLRFTIQDGGQPRFAELKELLDQSGLVIEELRR